ncbi:hypothetical protein C5167_001180 [Papaver somniferum]|uniref:Uncharacterized protein n=1 Tax=Papaver somniferum TaxID=3469 RepID=A0A4Y7KX94_PAPSO|nr:hypothetical protein C5167_001180 [Papaver somniferum]
MDEDMLDYLLSLAYTLLRYYQVTPYGRPTRRVSGEIDVNLPPREDGFENTAQARQQGKNGFKQNASFLVVHEKLVKTHLFSFLLSR